jgi:hypothetical protein
MNREICLSVSFDVAVDKCVAGLLDVSKLHDVMTECLRADKCEAVGGRCVAYPPYVDFVALAVGEKILNTAVVLTAVSTLSEAALS